MYTQNSSYRTRAIAATVLFLLAGLCSVVGGPLAANAQEPKEPAAAHKASSGQFLGSQGTIEIKSVKVEKCDTDPTVTVRYVVKDQDGLARVDLTRDSGSDTEYFRTVLVNTSKTRLVKVKQFTERFTLTDYEALSSTRIRVDATDKSKAKVSNYLELAIDDWSCTVDYRDSSSPLGTGPNAFTELNWVEIDNCASEPELTVSYWVTDADGVLDVTLSGTVGSTTINDNLYYGAATSWKPPEKTSVSVVGKYPVDLGSSGSSTGTLTLNVDDLEGNSSDPSNLTLDIDKASCTVESNAPSDLAGPEIVVESVTAKNCSTKPKLTFVYTVSDSSGLDALTLKYRKSFTSDATKVVDLSRVVRGKDKVKKRVTVSLDKRDGYLDYSYGFDAVDTQGNKASVSDQLIIDPDTCAVTTGVVY